MKTMNRKYKTLALAAALGLMLAPTANAAEGRIEFNLAKVLAGGVTLGDAPGFPAEIRYPGSYILTGNLPVPAKSHGIVISANNVTLDLNGFVIDGKGATAEGDGIRCEKNSASRITVRNGGVRGMDIGVNLGGGAFTNNLSRVEAVDATLNYIGISVGEGSIVTGSNASFNRSLGIWTLGNALVTGNMIIGNGNAGISVLGSGVGYSGNVLNNNGDADVAGGDGVIEMGANICGGDTICP
jgi:hypothetical protein